MVKENLYPIINKFLQCCVPYGNYKRVTEPIRNEKFCYLAQHHGKKFVEDMLEIGNAVYERRLMRICYQKLKENDQVMRMIQLVGLMFSKYYFYLCAFIYDSEETPVYPNDLFRQFTELTGLQSMRY